MDERFDKTKLLVLNIGVEKVVMHTEQSYPYKAGVLNLFAYGNTPEEALGTLVNTVLKTYGPFILDKVIYINVTP